MIDDLIENAFINEAAKTALGGLLASEGMSLTTEHAAKLAYDYAKALNAERRRRRSLADKAPKKDQGGSK